VRSTLDNLMKGPAALDKAYKDAIERIDGQLAEDRSLAKRAISWISYAQRPLTSQELCQALAIELGDKQLNEDNVIDIEDVVSVCAGLVLSDEESGVVRLVHYTTHDYFEQSISEWNSTARQEIASICLTYLAFDTFQCGSCSTDAEFEERQRKNAFLDYAVRYWADHVRSVDVTVSNLALALLQDNSLISSMTQIMFVAQYKYEGYSQRFPHATTGLHLSASLGLTSVSGMLLASSLEYSKTNVDAKDSYGRTPLICAAGGGHEAVIKLLLQTGKVDLNAKDRSGRTPLSHAAIRGHEALVRLLLETGKVDVNVKDKYGRTPLLHAAGNGYKDVVQLLVEVARVDVDAKDGSGRTPLSYAAEGGHEAVVQLLIQTGRVDVDTKDGSGRTPLLHAAGRGHEVVVQLLIETGRVDVDVKDKDGRTPLSYAARKGYEAVVRLLVETGIVNVNVKDDDGRTPLIYAAIGGYKAIIQMLVETGNVDFDIEDENGWTPLFHDARGGSKDVVDVLSRNTHR
jgi:ankyrin repeat protein